MAGEEASPAAGGGGSFGTSGGFWYTWWAGDPLPELAALDGFAMEALAEAATIAQMTALSVAETRVRLESGHRCFAARVGAAVAGYGWCATMRAEIGELGLSLVLPKRNTYLWGFETLPPWRGQGVYSHLLQAVVRHTARVVERVWIGHETGNDALARGILRTGFQRVGELFVLAGGAMELRAEASAERAAAGAAVLGVRLSR